MKCYYCDKPAKYLCDFIVGAEATDEGTEFKTCDRPLCRKHAKQSGWTHGKGKDGWFDSIDYCPGHARYVQHTTRGDRGTAGSPPQLRVYGGGSSEGKR